jgi:hypothetical protein
LQDDKSLLGLSAYRHTIIVKYGANAENQHHNPAGEHAYIVLDIANVMPIKSVTHHPSGFGTKYAIAKKEVIRYAHPHPVGNCDIQSYVRCGQSGFGVAQSAGRSINVAL